MGEGPLELVESRPNADALEKVRALLEQIIACEVDGVAFVALRRGRGHYGAVAGIADEYPAQTAGLLGALQLRLQATLLTD